VAEPLLRLDGISRVYGGFTAVAPTDLALEAGSFTALLGPSGCGKSTLLHMIAGFTTPSSGRVMIDGRDVTRLGPEQRPTNIVFQSHGLFPHMTVAENVGFGPMIGRSPRAEVARRVADALDLVRLTDRADAAISELSGGQQQRVALARALIMRPRLLLLDEPLSALDLKLRQDMQAELARIHREIGGTFLFVTHDQGEAFALADRLIVMDGGSIVQDGSPHSVYRRPASLFVARFVGDVNVLGTPDKPLVLRPEDVRLIDRPEPGSRPATLISSTHLGSHGQAVLRLGDGQDIIAHIAPADRVLGWRTGQGFHLTWSEDALVPVAP
jgi:ABC-type Fe3+/spermidine/putrescine transport system ATPase subunit